MVVMMNNRNLSVKKYKGFNPLPSARTIFQYMTNATTLVTSLSSSVGTILQDMSDLVAVVTSRLVAVLGTVPVVAECEMMPVLSLGTWQCVRLRSTDSTCRLAPGSPWRSGRTWSICST